jgi:co-chaperonin GroES (HSP10)
MSLGFDKQSLEDVLMIGDKVLIQPKSPMEKTKSGLYLPPGIQEKENIYSGYIVKVGPGYPIPNNQEYDEPWKAGSEESKYIPLQAKVGDLAVYLQTGSFPIEINKQKYVILPHSAILMLFRDKGLME